MKLHSYFKTHNYRYDTEVFLTIKIYVCTLNIYWVFFNHFLHSICYLVLFIWSVLHIKAMAILHINITVLTTIVYLLSISIFSIANSKLSQDLLNLNYYFQLITYLLITTFLTVSSKYSNTTPRHLNSYKQ